MIAIIPMKGEPRTSVASLADWNLGPGAVKVSLSRDGEYVGAVCFPINGPVNPRATEATFLLSGSYIRINGDAMFDVADSALMWDVLEAL